MRAGKTGEIPIGMGGWSGMPRVQRQLLAVPMGFTKVFFRAQSFFSLIDLSAVLFHFVPQINSGLSL